MYLRRVLQNGRTCLGGLSRLWPKRLSRDQSGAVAVEFGIVALPFFTLVFAIMQLALVFVTDQVLETAVADAARMIRTGQAANSSGGPWGVTQFNAQVCSELYNLLDCTQLETFISTATSFGTITLTPPINPQTGAFSSQPTYDSAANTASQIVVVSTYYEYPTLFSSFGLALADQPNGTRLLGAVAAFRNEPFP